MPRVHTRTKWWSPTATTITTQEEVKEKAGSRSNGQQQVEKTAGGEGSRRFPCMWWTPIQIPSPTNSPMSVVCLHPPPLSPAQSREYKTRVVPVVAPNASSENKQKRQVTKN